MIEKIGGRKVIFGLLFLVVGVALALSLGDLPRNLMEFMIFLSAGFFLGNGVEHVAGALTRPTPTGSTEASSQIDNVAQSQQAIQEQLQQLSAQTQAATEGVALVQQAISLIMERAGMTKK